MYLLIHIHKHARTQTRAHTYSLINSYTYKCINSLKYVYKQLVLAKVNSNNKKGLGGGKAANM